MYVTCYSGIMSRSHLLSDAYYCAKKYEKKPFLYIIWKKDEDCYIDYYDAFSKKQFCDIKVIVKNVDCVRNSKKGFIKKLQFCLLFKEIVREIREKILLRKRSLYYFDYKDEPLVENSNFSVYDTWKKEKWNSMEKEFERRRIVHINAYESFCYSRKLYDVSSIIFNESLLEKAEAIINGEKNIVGIHIRRTDHTICKNFSPSYLFCKLIDDEISKNETVKFYLSTDDKNELQSFIKKYNGRIVSYNNKKWSRSDSDGIKDAIIECVCLSKCNRIIGSWTSQFSEFAAEYGNINIEYCRIN